jgi:phosphoribosylanthranilate isomerase
MTPPIFPAAGRLGVKICGITTLDQAQSIADLGADALGINFWPGSKRYLDPALAASWLSALQPLTTVVAVLVNPEPALIDRLVATPLAHVLQLHGDEPPSMVGSLMERGLEIIKALQVRDRASLEAIGDYPCRTLLLDAHNPGSYGGGGTPFPWELFTAARERFPDKTLILSGGLTPANVAEAVRQTRPAAVDVASGVERAPGIKDLDQVAAFIAAARAAGA